MDLTCFRRKGRTPDLSDLIVGFFTDFVGIVAKINFPTRMRKWAYVGSLRPIISFCFDEKLTELRQSVTTVLDALKEKLEVLGDDFDKKNKGYDTETTELVRRDGSWRCVSIGGILSGVVVADCFHSNVLHS